MPHEVCSIAHGDQSTCIETSVGCLGQMGRIALHKSRRPSTSNIAVQTISSSGQLFLNDRLICNKSTHTTHRFAPACRWELRRVNSSRPLVYVLCVCKERELDKGHLDQELPVYLSSAPPRLFHMFVNHNFGPRTPMVSSLPPVRSST
jgi:hypothetical protein